MKNKEMKKVLALALLFAMTANAVACGSQAATDNQAPVAETQAAESEAEPTADAEPAAQEKLLIEVTADAETAATVNGIDDELCSWTTGGRDASTLGGDDYAFTPVVYVDGGNYAADKSVAGEIAQATGTEISGVDIEIAKNGVNGIMINNSDYTISDSVVAVNAASADGSDTCDFSGLGAAIAAYGDSNIVVKDTTILSDGVADLGVFVDKGATALLDNVSLHSDGGSLYANYVNSPAQDLMVAPPWILGIMGNSRGTNLMGDNSTMSVIDSDTSASNWAVLSTDSGSNMYLNVVNTTMTLKGSDEPLQIDGAFDETNPYTTRSGYGTYAIGAAVETFLGTTMEVGTYATIFTGGTGYYGNLKAGETYDLLAADGTTHYSYTAEADVPTVINSDTFGFMSHQGDNVVVIDGATVNSEYTNFLVKSGNSTDITIKNGATINAKNGILLQLLDNDDSTTDFNPQEMAFGADHKENAGFPTEAVEIAEADAAADAAPADAAPEGEAPEGEAPAEGGAEGGAPEGEGGGGMMPQDNSPTHSVYNVVDNALTGSIYNGVGWNANDLSNGKVRQMTLEVNLSGTSTLAGAIASTSCIHATYEGQQYLKQNNITAFNDDAAAAEFAKTYQNTLFTQAHYFDIGQVANLVKYNGLNDIDVTVSDDAVWTVTDTSLINSLKISGNAQVVVADGVTLTVNGKAYEAGTYTAADFN